MSIGVMDKIRTGFALLDVLLCLLLPAVLHWVTGQVSDLLRSGSWPPHFRRRLDDAARLWRRRGGRTTCERMVTYEKAADEPWWWGGDRRADGAHNHILQRAILLYINHLEDVAKRFQHAQLLLSAPESGDSSAEQGEEGCEAAKDEATRLAAYRVIASPPLNEWVTVYDDRSGSTVEFMRREHSCSGVDRDDGGRDDCRRRGRLPAVTKATFHIRATAQTSAEGRDAEALAVGFVGDAYQHYLTLIQREREGSRFFYQPLKQAASEAASAASADCGLLPPAETAPTYKRYLLTDSKTFGTGFFHPDKDAILSLVRSFTDKTGKFAVAGFPHKLGLLLHGPPGTGKTSLIKALASHTRRHIVSVPLNKVATNQELMDIMFDRRYRVVGQSLPVFLPLSKTIFVMEDVDAACAVVKSRAPEPPETPTPQPDGAGTAKQPPKPTEDPDKLNLAGLLNVLDGVLDSPERIVVMTTNHPEKLDPALVRPGRINMTVFLGHIRGREALQMVEHYFGELAPPEARAVSDAVGRRNVTPAELEMLCGQNDAVEGLCRSLAGGPAGYMRPPRAPTV